MTQPPADWYPDPRPPLPGAQPQLRYWDGHQWTEHLAPGAGPQSVRSAAPVATTPDGEPLAGWWWRVLAALIDTALLGIVNTLVTLPAQFGLQRDLQRLNEELTHQIETNPAVPDIGAYFNQMLAIYQDRAWALFVPGLVIFLIYVPPMLRWKGATVGKLACGLRVRRRDAPGQLPWSTIAVRITVQFLVIQALVIVAFSSGTWVAMAACMIVWTTFGLLDPLWAAWDGKKQALHDKAAKTNVVRTR